METKEITRKDFQAIEQPFLRFCDEKTYMREVSFALQAINKSQYLQQATTESKQQAVLNVAQLGLSLNPVLKYAALVPKRQGNAWTCVLQPQYQGLVKLITDTKSVITTDAQIVREGDEFDYGLGLEPFIRHKPKLGSEQRPIIAAYAYAVLPGGVKQVEIMDIETLDKIREASDSYQAYKAKKVSTCVWVTWHGEMCRKSVLKRLCKWLPKTEQWEPLAKAIALDDEDYQLESSSQKAEYLLDLAHKVHGGNHVYESILNEVKLGMAHTRANDLIDSLRDNLPDPIENGMPYTATQATRKVNQITSDH